MTMKKTFCSLCSAFCGFEAEIDGNTIVAMHPDKEHPMSQGFSCSKGRNSHTLLTTANRIHRAQRRQEQSWQSIDKSQALDEIASRLKSLIDEYGPESVAIYCGNGVTFKTTTMPTVHGFMRGIGSHQVYSSLTIDQPAKILSIGRHGIWAGGGHSFDTARVLMLIGNNVLVSGLHGPGSIPGWRPGALKKARERGLKLIVVDPRYTETARQADLHLAIKPGTDAAFLSGVINWILFNNLHDSDFCERFTDGLEDLREQLSDFSLSHTAAITGLDEDQIRQAAELFVTQQRGTVSSATGPDMAPHANLTEHLIYSLNTLCGRHNRAGDKVSTSLLTPDFPPMEAVVPADFLPELLNPACNTRRSRLSGAHQLFQEMPTATLADEIITPGEGQIRALLVIGGNPVLSIPDQDKTRKALQALDLCVCIDVRESDTAQYADYLLPASYGLERSEMTNFNDTFWDRPFHQVSSALVQAPGDACPEYHYLAALANRLGTPINYPGGEIDTANPPDGLGIMKLMYPEGTTKVSIDEIAKYPAGHVFEQYAAVEVIPALEGMNDRLQLMPEGVDKEFELLKTMLEEQAGDNSFLLICRRNPHVYNSMCHELPQAPSGNPACLHPETIKAAGLSSGQTVVITSASGEVEAQLQEDSTLRPGVVSMTHGFGGDHGTSVNRLLTTQNSTDRYTGIPQMSAVPVQIRAASQD